MHARFARLRGFSSAGRAPALQAGGRRFDPDKLHHLWWFGRPFLVALAIRGAKSIRWVAHGMPIVQSIAPVVLKALPVTRYPLEKYTIACAFGPVPVLIHRKEKILSGGFQV